MKPTESLMKDYKLLSRTLPAIKGLAILLVVAYHLWGFTKGYLPFTQIVTEASGQGLKGLFEGVLNVVCRLGEQGVHFFLIASGFGLAASWWQRYHNIGTKSEQFSVISFWRRRLSRIFPLYWLAHGLAVILLTIDPSWVPFGGDIWHQGAIEVMAAIIASLTTLRNFIEKYYYFINSTWWYIGLSVQLYLVFPLLIWVGKRRGWSILLAGSLLISLVYRTIVVSLHLNQRVTDALMRGAIFPSRLFEFVFGIILAIALLEQSTQMLEPLLSWSKKLLLERRWMGLTGLLWITGLACHWASFEGWSSLRIPADALIGIGEFCVVFQVLTLVPLVCDRLNPLGNYSYGIYLTHSNIFVALWTMLIILIPYYWLRFVIVVAVSCFLGGLFEFGYHWLENRLLHKKHT